MTFRSSRELRKKPSRTRIGCVFAAWVLVTGWQANVLQAEDAYYRIPLARLVLIEGKLPTYGMSDNYSGAKPTAVLSSQPYATIDSEGEVYVGGETFDIWLDSKEIFQGSFLAIRASAGQEIKGLLFVPKPDFSGMVRLPFKIAPTNAAANAKKDFLEARKDHYGNLRSRNIPGAAWFRHQEETANSAQTGAANLARGQRERNFPDETYSLLTGGRAVSENLQLDRVLPASRNTTTGMVDIATIKGITIAPMDWKPLLKDAKPELDPLAAAIPADQHALFFSTFQAMMTVIDEADANGTPLLRMIEPRAEDMDTRHRYQKQLCLGLSDLSRRIGPQVVDAIAMTGSDPYLRMGSDVGVLFQTKKPDLLKSLIVAQQTMMASAAGSEAKALHGEIEGVAYAGVVSPDRSVSSYIASAGEVVFVSNSLEQLTALIEASKGSRTALVSQDDYIYFRTRYRRGDPDESAFLVLSDATIRRWCGPRWRIADSRRTKVVAALAELQAARMDALVQGTVESGSITAEFQIPEAGQITVTPRGVRSSVYGTLDFLTPIAELPMKEISSAEVDGYTNWREGYQRNSSQKFDPIGARFIVKPGQIGLELTVTPLILNTEYRELLSLTSGARIAPTAGDAHAGTLAHFIMAIDKKSTPAMQAGTFVGTMAPGLKANPFGWLGSSISLYADEDPFWSELMKARNADAYLEGHYWELPVALRVEVGNPLGAAAFLTALRAYANQTAPDMTVWETRDYQGRSYVRVTSPSMTAEAGGTNVPGIFYSTGPDALVVTFNEALLKRAMDRESAITNAKAAGKSLPVAATPWLGTNLCFKVEQSFLKIIEHMAGESFQNSQQLLAWNNLPILNEWKHRYPNQDPVKLHERFWQAKLVCPGGGDYVWNEKWQTMESTVYGSPAEPKTGTGSPNFGPLTRLKSANLGLNFENQGISARAIFERESK